ncbi:hypothetical protein TR13x_05220 [Caloranaerobacter sp. TR13]|nr:hypothetical protein TR13x_05220 [Caloranaerobacter sp. TR13]
MKKIILYMLSFIISALIMNILLNPRGINLSTLKKKYKAAGFIIYFSLFIIICFIVYYSIQKIAIFLGL